MAKQREWADRPLVCRYDYKSCHTALCNSTHLFYYNIRLRTPAETQTVREGKEGKSEKIFADHF